VSQPVVANGRVIYAPPDAESLFAFDLRDGSLAWERKRGKGVYLAGSNDNKVIVIETGAVLALSTADGKERWRVPFDGTLTGRGAFRRDGYYLPLGQSKNEGSILAIDLKAGKALGVLKGKDKESFGNLLIHKGKLISQSFEALAIYELP
jgi:outer membrane protein assembly factor BamB